MRLFVVILITALACGCAAKVSDYPTVGKPTKKPNCPDYSDTLPGFYGGDGSSEDQAVEMVGLDYSSYRWIEERYPGAEVTLQELVISPTTKRRFDVMTFRTTDGQVIKAWFWISGGIGCR